MIRFFPGLQGRPALLLGVNTSFFVTGQVLCFSELSFTASYAGKLGNHEIYQKSKAKNIETLHGFLSILWIQERQRKLEREKV